MTAPIRHLSSIEQSPTSVSTEDEAVALSQALRRIEDRAASMLDEEIRKLGTVEPVGITDGFAGTQRGEPPSPEQLELLRRELHVEAVLYGEIPWYGQTRLIYPALGEGLDISAESVALGFATGWNPTAILANVGFELLTSTPLWFGGAYVFGWAFRPVKVNASAVSTEDGKTIWRDSSLRVVPRKVLNTYPEFERSKKEVQLEASLRAAMQDLADSLGVSERSWFGALWRSLPW